MPEENPKPATLSYATPVVPTRNSAYATASLVVAAFFLSWQYASILAGRPFVFDIYKECRIIAAGATLALILAFASYRQSFRRRTLSHVAITVAAVALMSALLIVPL